MSLTRLIQREQLYVCAARESQGCMHVDITAESPSCHGVPMRSAKAQPTTELILIQGGIA